MEPLTFLTWNLALMERSASAPPWWGLEHTEALVRQTVLSRDPDLVVLQELPRLVPYVETHEMVRANPETHSGNLAVLVRRSLLDPDPAVRVVPRCAVLVTFDQRLTVANVHLPPGGGAAAAARRLEQLATVIETSPTPTLAVVGDTNTRRVELRTIGEAGLVVPDLPRPTWDSVSNRFRASGRRFRASFTRCFTSPGVTITDLDVLDRPVVHDGYRFHLSDHFALAGTMCF